MGIKNEYIRRVKNIIKSKLSGGNIIKGQFQSGIVKWTKVVHQRNTVNRLYLSRGMRRRGILQQTIEEEKRRV